MEERQITVDGATRKLEGVFMVLATQNPIESLGTFPLPEAQLDRFFMRISMGYPKRHEEISIIRRSESSALLEELACVISPEELDYVKGHYTEVRVSEDVMNYLMDLVEATRLDERIRLGISPRGSLALFRASQAKAAVSGRDYMIPEDVQGMARYVFNHRLVVKGGTRSNSIYEPVERILSSVKVPVEDI